MNFTCVHVKFSVDIYIFYPQKNIIQIYILFLAKVTEFLIDLGLLDDLSVRHGAKQLIILIQKQAGNGNVLN